MRKIIKWTLFFIISFFIFVISFFFINATVEKIIISNKIDSFMEKGIYKEELSNDYEKYYEVKMDGEERGYTMNGSIMLPGNVCDILVSPNTHAFHPIISSFVSYNVGGHAAIVTDNYSDAENTITDIDSIEADYYDNGKSPAKISYRSYWNDTTYFDEVIGLRAKLSQEEKKEVMSVLYGQLGDPYNISFLFDTKNKTYCSDLITKVFSSVGIDTNKDGYFTTIYDIITTEELYITYYHYYKDGIKYIYYV